MLQANEALLVNFPNLEIVDVSRAALQQGAAAFVTNDRGLRRVHSELSILLLDDFVAGATPHYAGG